MAMKKTTSKLDELKMREFAESLFEANIPYAEIQKVIQERTGETISDSALSRAYQKWQREQMAAEAIEREVETMMKALSGNPALDMKKTVLGVFWAKVAKRFGQADLQFDKADALDMSHLLLKAFRTEQAGGQLDLQKERIELMKSKVAKVADSVKDKLTAAGASKEDVTKLVDEILGVTA
ncbi:MAG: phage protein Gp27 family protein [Elusimicrobiota bacterium]